METRNGLIMGWDEMGWVDHGMGWDGMGLPVSCSSVLDENTRTTCFFTASTDLSTLLLSSAFTVPVITSSFRSYKGRAELEKGIGWELLETARLLSFIEAGVEERSSLLWILIGEPSIVIRSAFIY